MSEAVQAKVNKKSALRFKRTYFAFPYLLISLVFVIVPLGILLVRSFIRDGSFSLANFIEFFTDGDLWWVMGRSFLIGAVTTVLCLLLAYPLAMILANSKINKTAILVLLFILPMWINSLLRTYAIKSVFELLDITNDYARITIAMVYDFFPFMLLPIYTVLVNMDKAYGEASRDLGAGAVKTFLKVMLPLSLSGIMSGILMVFMPAISTFSISKLVAGGTSFLFGELINDYFEKGMYNIGSAYAFILLLMILVTMFIANKLTGQTQTRGGIL